MKWSLTVDCRMTVEKSKSHSNSWQEVLSDTRKYTAEKQKNDYSIRTIVVSAKLMHLVEYSQSEKWRNSNFTFYFRLKKCAFQLICIPFKWLISKTEHNFSLWANFLFIYWKEINLKTHFAQHNWRNEKFDIRIRIHIIRIVLLYWMFSCCSNSMKVLYINNIIMLWFCHQLFASYPYSMQTKRFQLFGSLNAFNWYLTIIVVTLLNSCWYKIHRQSVLPI